MRRSSLHGFGGSLAGINFNSTNVVDVLSSESSPRPPGVNSLAIAAARSKRRVRRAAPNTVPGNVESSGKVPAVSKARRIREGFADSDRRRAAEAERRNQANKARLNRDTQSRRTAKLTASIQAAATRSAASTAKAAAQQPLLLGKQRTPPPSRRVSAKNGKLLLAAATAAGSFHDGDLSGGVGDGEATSSSLCKLAFEPRPQEEAHSTAEVEQVKVVKPCLHFKCVDPRGANFRTKPSPEALVGDGSGVDPGEVVHVCARTKNWLKVDTRSMGLVTGSRWVPLRMYWGDNKQLFTLEKTTRPEPPATQPRADVIVAKLTVAEFNSINFTCAREGFPLISRFEDGPVLRTAHGDRLHVGMALLTIGKWSLVRSRLATVAAMLNSRPDASSALVEAKFRLPLFATHTKDSQQH